MELPVGAWGTECRGISLHGSRTGMVLLQDSVSMGLLLVSVSSGSIRRGQDSRILLEAIPIRRLARRP